MRIKPPAPFTFEAGPRAVLLLHGFTGHSADVRMLGRYLEKKGYTTHAPIYRGHGVTPEELIETTPTDWWEDVVQAYDYLGQLGYDEIAVAGLSMGGALGLKLANCKQVKAVIPMCAPVYFDNKEELTNGFRFFAKQYKQLEKKDDKLIEDEVNTLMENSIEMFNNIGVFVKEVNEMIDMIYAPTMVVQARNDQMVNPEGANFIYEHIATEKKILKWYEKSGHLITMDIEKDLLHDNIYTFLQSLNWEQ